MPESDVRFSKAPMTGMHDFPPSAVSKILMCSRSIAALFNKLYDRKEASRPRVTILHFMIQGCSATHNTASQILNQLWSEAVVTSETWV